MPVCLLWTDISPGRTCGILSMRLLLPFGRGGLFWRSWPCGLPKSSATLYHPVKVPFLVMSLTFYSWDTSCSLPKCLWCWRWGLLPGRGVHVFFGCHWLLSPRSLHKLQLPPGIHELKGASSLLQTLCWNKVSGEKAAKDVFLID